MNRKVILGFYVLTLIFSIKVSAQDVTPVTYKVDAPEQASKKDGFAISVNFVTNGEWYIYAPTGLNEKNGMIETRLQFNLPKGITKGDLDLPMPKPYGMYQIYQGDNIKMSQHFSVSNDLVPGNYDIECIVTYQTCNKSVCLPPDTKTYVKTITIK